MPQTPSTRWCPTSEQLMILEEMYRSGVRTPNASQIQQITAHLSFYGKIEGKNVFYWFQNHKARDRQKLRRHLSRHHHQLLTHGFNHLRHLQHLQDHASPNSQLYHPHYYPPHHFLHHHQVNFLEVTGIHPPPKPPVPQVQESTQNLLSQLETGSGAACGCEWTVMVEPSGPSVRVPPIPPSTYCMRPLRTLELFPTTTTGLKDECSTSKSSSCYTSTN